MLESPGYSEDFSAGYGRAVLEMLRQVGYPMWKDKSAREGKSQPAAEAGKNRAEEGLGPRQDQETKAGRPYHVNILGLSLWQLYQEGDREELERILGMCGIKVNTFLCAGSSLEELEKLPEADLNIVVYEENDGGCAAWLQETCGTPYYICRRLPIGFDETDRFIEEVCRVLGGDSDLTAFRQAQEKARALAWYKVNEIYQMCGLPKGVSFAVCGTADQEAAYTAFLKDYLGMTPTDPGQAELIFSDANVISEMMTKRSGFCGIQISLPGMGYV
ncbi:MAG: nitrogenase component 1, partial [Lachnospiraceae bacterium]